MVIVKTVKWQWPGTTGWIWAIDVFTALALLAILKAFIENNVQDHPSLRPGLRRMGRQLYAIIIATCVLTSLVPEHGDKVLICYVSYLTGRRSANRNRSPAGDTV